MKKNAVFTLIVVALAALVAMPLVAQGPQGRGGFGRGMGMGPGGPGGPGGRGGGPMFALRGIQLTDAQRDQIRAIMDEHRSDAPVGRTAELNKQLQLAILADTPDTAKLEELKQAIATATAEQLGRRIEVETRIVQVLTPAQRAEARQNIGKWAPPQGRGR